ncbi:hypothetical protein SY88_04210 [Clostridiales bacterium PH28_bin88]|nr:hypothetical protein SY88_04210 [Clostridiales bacterium PH28_bin88]
MPENGDRLVLNKLQQVQQEVHLVAASLHAGEAAGGIKRMGGVVEGLQDLIGLLAGILVAEGEIDKFNRMLQEILQAWENTDYVQMADLLHYELIPQLEQWERQVN